MSEAIGEIVALARQGKSAKEIGELLGCGKNAVLGRTFRAGIKLGELNGWAKRAPRAPKPRKRYVPRSANVAKDPAKVASHARQRARAAALGSTNGRYPEAFKVQVVAAYLAGVPAKKLETRFSVCHRTLYAFWFKDTGLLAKAGPIAERVRAEADAARAAFQRQERARLSAERMRRQMHNAAILPKVSARCRLICERYLEGQTLQQIGDELGLTRERIRQLMAPAMRLGLDTSGIRTAPVRAVAKAYEPKGPRERKPPKERKGRLGWTPEMREAARQRLIERIAQGQMNRSGRLKGSKNRNGYTISDEERKRRGDRLRAYWAARS